MVFDRKSLSEGELTAGFFAAKRQRGRPKRTGDPRKSRVIENALSERLSEAVVAAWFCVPLAGLRGASRSIRPVAKARQAGMYLIHVVFSANLTRAGRAFGRDRTTARHACALVEEWRDRPSLDIALDRLEPSLRAWTEVFAHVALHNGGSIE